MQSRSCIWVPFLGQLRVLRLLGWRRRHSYLSLGTSLPSIQNPAQKENVSFPRVWVLRDTGLAVLLKPTKPLGSIALLLLAGLAPGWFSCRRRPSWESVAATLESRLTSPPLAALPAALVEARASTKFGPCLLSALQCPSKRGLGPGSAGVVADVGAGSFWGKSAVLIWVEGGLAIASG